jgi:hypothetical protein
MIPGYGAMQRRKFSTQINLGTFIPDGVNSINQGTDAFQYPLYADESNPSSVAMTRKPGLSGEDHISTLEHGSIPVVSTGMALPRLPEWLAGREKPSPLTFRKWKEF